MRGKNSNLIRGAFGALVVGALGFGATQALAAQPEPCTNQQYQACRSLCEGYYGPGAPFLCYMQGECECLS